MPTYSHVGLLGELDLAESLAGSDHVLVLDTHDTTAPLSALLLVVVVLLSELGGELVQVLHVLLVDFGQSDTGGSLQVAKLTEGSLSADEAVRNVLFAAKSGQVNHNLNGVNVVGNDHESSLAFFDKGGHVVKTELDVEGLGSLGSTALLSLSLESELLLDVGLGLVLAQELEELGSLVLLNGLGELVDGGRDLESVEQDALLSLDAHVVGPSDEAGQVLGLSDITTDTEVAGALLEEG